MMNGLTFGCNNNWYLWLLIIILLVCCGGCGCISNILEKLTSCGCLIPILIVLLCCCNTGKCGGGQPKGFPCGCK